MMTVIIEVVMVMMVVVVMVMMCTKGLHKLKRSGVNVLVKAWFSFTSDI